MREIKFRAWLIKYKLMVYFGLFDTDMTYLYYAKNKNGDYDLFVDEENDPIMQYTSYKDRKNIEIWEDDIGRYIDEENRINKFIFEMTVGGYRKLEEFLYYRGVIIGNKWENPELLK